MTSQSSQVRSPRFNHVAMSLPADSLDASGRAEIVNFYEKVFGWEELSVMTVDRQRLVLSCHTYEQFVFLVAEDAPMTAPLMDHFGLSVASESELDAVLQRAKEYQKTDDRVRIIDKTTDDHGMLTITSIYISYLLPMMVEIQHWNFTDGRSDNN